MFVGEGEVVLMVLLLGGAAYGIFLAIHMSMGRGFQEEQMKSPVAHRHSPLRLKQEFWSKKIGTGIETTAGWVAAVVTSITLTAVFYFLSKDEQRIVAFLVIPGYIPAAFFVGKTVDVIAKIFTKKEKLVIGSGDIFKIGFSCFAFCAIYYSLRETDIYLRIGASCFGAVWLLNLFKD
jgi:hypothetical protein